MLVTFCCNDERGNFTGRVVEIQFGDLARLASSNERGLAMKKTDMDAKVSRRWFPCWDWQVWVGNVYWDAAKMKTGVARMLVQYLLRHGWVVEEYAEDGPLVDLVTERSP